VIAKMVRFLLNKLKGLRRLTIGIPVEEGLRRDVKQYYIQKDAFLRVYWKALRIGVGPSAALYVDGKQVVRFDCFGQAGGKILGHYHVHLNHSTDAEFDRTYFTDGAVEDQIDTARRMLLEEVPSMLKDNRDAAIRDCKLDPQRLAVVASRMRKRMRRYVRKVNLDRYAGPFDEIDDPALKPQT
jgi:hypothetical protein